MTPDELSLLQAFLEGQKAGELGQSAGMNTYQDGTPEFCEWERGRSGIMDLNGIARAAGSFC